MSDDPLASTNEVKKLPRGLVHKVLETELGKNWRSIRWWGRQFTPVSASILGAVITAAGTWIITLSHKVDNQGTKITVLETEVIPDLKLAERVTNHEGRIIGLEAALGKFNYVDAIRAAAELDEAARKKREEAERMNKARSKAQPGRGTDGRSAESARHHD